MERILSFDLDFLFPQLDDFMEVQYNKGETPNDYWDRMSEKYDKDLYNMKPHFKPQLVLDMIFRTIKSIDNLKPSIHLITKHQEILNLINDEVEIINLDQHHDICYSHSDKTSAIIGDKEEVKSFESNWVLYLHYKGLLKSYSWVGNLNSNFGIEHLRYPFSFYLPVDEIEYCNQYGISDKIEDLLRNNKFDKIVFVLSPYYTPNNKYINDIIHNIKQLQEKYSCKVGC